MTLLQNQFASHGNLLLILLCKILLAGWFLRIYNIGIPPAWHDETYTALAAMLPIDELVARSAADIHPPLHFLLLHVWMPLAGSSEFALRYISAAWNLLAVALTGALGRMLYKQVAGILAAFLLAFSPFAVAYAQEIRLYAMLQALLLAASTVLVCWTRTRNPRLLLAYIVLAVASLLTNYYAATVLGAHALWVLLRWLGMYRTTTLALGRWRTQAYTELLHYMLAGVTILLLYTPQLFVAFRQISDYSALLLKPLAPQDFIAQIWQAYTLGPAVDRQWFSELDSSLIVMAVIAMLLGSISLFKQPRSESLFLLLWLIVPLAGMFLLTLRRPFFHPRFVLLALPAYLLLISGGLSPFFNKVSLELVNKRTPSNPQRAMRNLILSALVGATLLFSLLAVSIPGLQSYYFNERFAREDTRSLSVWLEAQTNERDAVIIDVEYLLEYYYRGRAPQTYMLADELTSAQRLTEFAGRAERVFLVNWYQADADPKGYIPYLLDRYGQRTEKQVFRGYTVTVWKLPGATTFVPAADWRINQARFSNRLELISQSYGGASGQSHPTATPACTPGTSGCQPPPVPSGERVWVALRWKVAQALESEYATVVYLRDQAGHVVGQSDRALMNNARLSGPRLAPDDEVELFYMIFITPGSPPGDYLLEAAAYDPATQRKLEAETAGGQRSQVVPLGPLKLTRQIRTPAPDTLGIQTPIGVDLNPDIRLLGYDLPQASIKSGDELNLTLYWQALRDVKQNYQFVVRLTDTSGQVLVDKIVTPAYASDNWRAGETLRYWQTLTLGAGISSGQARLSIALMDTQLRTVMAETQLGLVSIRGRDRNYTVPANIFTQPERFGNPQSGAPYIELLGYTLTPAEARPGEAIKLTLYWRCISTPPQNYTVFTQLVDGQNQIWAQEDRPPAAPTAGWMSGEILSETYTLSLKPDTPSGKVYTILTGFYDPANGGQRLALLDTTGKPVETRALLDTLVQVR